MFYTALIAASSGDSVLAEKNFKILATYNPYFEEGIIAAANFYRNQSKDQLKPYTILAEALQINGNSIRLLKAYVVGSPRDKDSMTMPQAQLSGSTIWKE